MSVATLPPESAEQNQPPSSAVAEELGESAGDNRAFDVPRKAAFVFLALLPFWAVPLCHILSDAGTATGFFHYELPYYVANGRAAFERGNGVLYPNPYDADAEAPAIYAHWLPWTFGFLTARLGFDSGDVILTFTLFASIAFALATRKLTRVRTQSERDGNTAFLAAMLGGGVLCAAGLLFAPEHGVNAGVSLSERLLAFDPGHGMWFLNWGRNALFPTEAIYHAIVAMCWIAEIRNRPTQANGWLILLAATHPWSGIELLLTVNLWRGICFLSDRTAKHRNHLLVSASLLAVFLAYYKLWLPSFASHAELQHVWELAWGLSWTSALFAYGPVLIPCVILLNRKLQTGSLERAERFLLCALCVAAGLAFHDRIIKPVQPLHFTRGYIWMPLFLLGLPLLLQWWKAAWQQSRTIGFAAAGILVVLTADNLIFSAIHCQRQALQQDGFHLDADERALYGHLHSSDAASSVVMTDSEKLNYLLPTYANARPWIGHQFNTPDFPQRKSTWEQCFPGGTVNASIIPDAVETLVVHRSRDSRSLADSTNWQPFDLRNANWRGWRRKN